MHTRTTKSQATRLLSISSAVHVPNLSACVINKPAYPLYFLPDPRDSDWVNMQDDGDAEPPAKMAKLAIIEEREEDKYEHVLALRHYRPSADAITAQDPSAAVTIPVEGITQADPRVRALVDGVMKSLSSGRQSEVQAWEEVFVPCEHTLTLEQSSTGGIPASGVYTCLCIT